MQSLKNDRFLRAIRREPVDVTPVWIMRQAGRYLPEYRATRARAGSFMNLCKTPELACEVTLQPIRRYPLDAAIIFSDILTIPDAMGLGLELVENEGPVFAHPVRTEAEIRRLAVPAPEQLAYVYDAISLVRHELAGKVPLIGFCGSPWTLAAYMVEGKAHPGFPTLQQMMMDEPQLLHKLLELLAKSVAMHLAAQRDAGAQALMLFDTWGGMLDDENYKEFSLAYMKRIIAELKYNNNEVPIILFTKNGSRWLEQMVQTACDVVAVDWTISLKEARSRVGKQVAIQGNLNPTCLLEPEQVIRNEVAKILDSFGQGSGHVFNLGHGITPDVPPEHVAVLVDAVHTLSAPFHAE